MAAKEKASKKEPVSDFRFRELLESVYDAVLITDLRGVIQMANGRAEEFFLLDREELCRKTIRDVISGFNETVFRKIFESLEGHKYIILDAYCVRNDGTTFPSEIAAHRIFLSADPQLCFSVRDVTARKEAECRLQEATEELLRAEKAKARLDTITTLAHEINNPLQMLLSMAELEGRRDYLEPLNRMSGVMEKLRSEEDLRAVSYAGDRERYEIPAPADTTPARAGAVLIVDDEATIRDVFRNILSAEFPGIEVDCATNGKEAVDAFSDRHHSVIILDIVMPEMNGEEAFYRIQRICRERRWGMPSVVFCTGFTPPETILEVVRKEKLHCYQPKPMSRETLVNTVRDCLELYKARHKW